MMSEYMNITNKPVTINRAMAVKIIERLKNSISYDVNIMDESGVIIASTNQQRVGNFHEIAYRILNTTSDTLEAVETDELIGTKNGINTVIKYKAFRVGVLGITGRPDEVRPFIHILKLTVETMIGHEFQLHELTLRNSQRSLFENGLMSGSETEVELVRWATELSIDRSAFRIPIWVKINGDVPLTHKTMLLGAITSNAYYSNQDIILQWKDNGLVIFKELPCTHSAQCEYKGIISSYLDEFLRKLDLYGLEPKAYVGSFTNCLSRYHEAYKRALWVFGNSPKSSNKVAFFYDQIDDWSKSFLPLRELHDIFFFFTQKCSLENKERFIAMEDSLSKNNYNFVQASSELFIHKNTLFHWVNSLKKQLSIDPVKKSSDRSLLKLMCYCLKQQAGM